MNMTVGNSEEMWGLEVLHHDLHEISKVADKDAKQAESLSIALEGLLQTSIALEGIQELTLQQAGYTIDILDIGLSRTGLGVEDMYPAVVDDIGGKPSQINAEGLLSRFVKHVIEILKRLWNTVLELWTKLSSFSIYSKDIAAKLRAELQALKTGKATTEVKTVDIGESAFALRVTLDSGKIISVQRPKEVIDGLATLAVVNEAVGDRFIPSIAKAQFALKETIDSASKTPKGELINVSAGLDKALKELDLKAISDLTNAHVPPEVAKQLHGEDGLQTFFSPILPGGKLIAINIPAGKTDNPLMKLSLSVLPLESEDTGSSVATMALADIEKALDGLSDIISYSANVKVIAFIKKAVTETMDIDKHFAHLLSVRDDFSVTENVTSVRAIIKSLQHVSQTGFALCLGLSKTNANAIKHGLKVTKLMLKQYSLAA